MSRGAYLQHKNNNGRISGLLDILIGFVAPHDCLFCGCEGYVACAWCLPGILQPVPSRCYRCMVLTDDNAVCDKCRRTSRLKHVWIATEYTEATKLLVHSLKFQRAQAAHQPMAAAMADCLPLLTTETIVTHIPTATSRVRQRGYDHSKLLASALASNKNCIYRPLLARLGQSRQVGAKRDERVAQIQDSFRVVDAQRLKQAHIILVDDVTTTGATIEAAAKLLRQAGAKQVDAVLFAQKQ
jgi:competence protein ComFC